MLQSLSPMKPGLLGWDASVGGLRDNLVALSVVGSCWHSYR